MKEQENFDSFMAKMRATGKMYDHKKYPQLFTKTYHVVRQASTRDFVEEGFMLLPTISIAREKDKYLEDNEITSCDGISLGFDFLNVSLVLGVVSNVRISDDFYELVEEHPDYIKFYQEEIDKIAEKKAKKKKVVKKDDNKKVSTKFVNNKTSTKQKSNGKI